MCEPALFQPRPRAVASRSEYKRGFMPGTRNTTIFKWKTILLNIPKIRTQCVNMSLQLDVLKEKTIRQLNIVPSYTSFAPQTQRASVVFNFFLDNCKYREKLKAMHVGVATNLREYVTQNACARWSVSIRKVKCLYCCTAYSILQVNWTLQPCVSETTSALIKFVIKTTGANSFYHREGIKAVCLPTNHWLYLLVAETKLLPTIIV